MIKAKKSGFIWHHICKNVKIIKANVYRVVLSHTHANTLRQLKERKICKTQWQQILYGLSQASRDVKHFRCFPGAAHNIILWYFILHSTVWAILPENISVAWGTFLHEMHHKKIYVERKENLSPLTFFHVSLFVSSASSLLSSVSSLICLRDEFLSRQAVGIFSSRWFSRRWRELLVIVKTWV